MAELFNKFGNVFGFGSAPEIPEGVEITHENFCERMGHAICGVCIGLILIPLSCGLLVWNEGRAVKTAKMLAEGRNVVVKADCILDPQNNGKLVHISCPLSNKTVIVDTPFNFSLPYPKLSRSVEMFEWNQESVTTEKKTTGGGTTKETCYYQEQKWSTSYVDTQSFKPRAGQCHTSCTDTHFVVCSNPTWDINQQTFVASPLIAGTYTIPVDLAQTLKVSVSTLPQSPVTYKGKIIPNDQILGNYVYTVMKTKGVDSIGDTRVSWKVCQATSASVLAKQKSGGTFEKWWSEYDKNYGIYKLAEGEKSADDMFTELEEQNRVMTWVLRFVFFFLIWFGLQLVTGPISLMPQFLPCVGNMLGEIVGCFLCYINSWIALSLAFFFIAVGWIAYRPIIGIPLVIVSFGICCLFCFLGWQRHSRKSRQEVYAQPYEQVHPIAYQQQNAQAPYQQYQQPPLGYQTASQ